MIRAAHEILLTMVLNTFLFLLSTKMLVILSGTEPIHVKSYQSISCLFTQSKKVVKG